MPTGLPGAAPGRGRPPRGAAFLPHSPLLLLPHPGRRDEAEAPTAEIRRARDSDTLPHPDPTAASWSPLCARAAGAPCPGGTLAPALPGPGAVSQREVPAAKTFLPDTGPATQPREASLLPRSPGLACLPLTAPRGAASPGSRSSCPAGTTAPSIPRQPAKSAPWTRSRHSGRCHARSRVLTAGTRRVRPCLHHLLCAGDSGPARPTWHGSRAPDRSHLTSRREKPRCRKGPPGGVRRLGARPPSAGRAGNSCTPVRPPGEAPRLPWAAWQPPGGGQEGSTRPWCPQCAWHTVGTLRDRQLTQPCRQPHQRHQPRVPGDRATAGTVTEQVPGVLQPPHRLRQLPRERVLGQERHPEAPMRSPGSFLPPRASSGALPVRAPQELAQPGGSPVGPRSRQNQRHLLALLNLKLWGASPAPPAALLPQPLQVALPQAPAGEPAP